MNGNQRWRERRCSFRRPDEQIRACEYDVERLANDVLAKEFVLRHHYAGTYPAARFRFGLFRHGEMVGAAVFSHPVNDRVLTGIFGGDAADSVELGRFVLLDEVPGNGETWFLARCLRVLRRLGLYGVVSFSDSEARTDADGRAVFPGHVGTIYQAGNATYLGRGKARTLLVLPDATVFSERNVSKIRHGEQGREYATRQLQRHGADDPATTVGRLYGTHADWLAHWLPRLARRVKHPGNHKYAWGFVRPLASSLPYPKLRST